MKLRELEFEGLMGLIEFLEKLSKKETPEERETFAEERLSGFFPSLTAVQEMELFYICKSKNRDAFNRFRDEYPDIEMDETGKSQPKDKRYWEIKEKALNEIYEFALEDLKKNFFQDRTTNKVNTQVYNAKNLSALKNMDKQKSEIYIFSRKLFVDNFKGDDFINSKTFNNIEKTMKLIGIKDPSKFLVNVINYCKGKKREKIILFLEHLFDRIEILSYDTELSSQTSKDLLDGINFVINKNN